MISVVEVETSRLDPSFICPLFTPSKWCPRSYPGAPLIQRMARLRPCYEREPPNPREGAEQPAYLPTTGYPCVEPEAPGLLAKFALPARAPPGQTNRMCAGRDNISAKASPEPLRSPLSGLFGLRRYSDASSTILRILRAPRGFSHKPFSRSRICHMKAATP